MVRNRTDGNLVPCNYTCMVGGSSKQQAMCPRCDGNILTHCSSNFFPESGRKPLYIYKCNCGLTFTSEIRPASEATSSTKAVSDDNGSQLPATTIAYLFGPLNDDRAGVGPGNR
jgi:hypothetical protein